MEQPTTCGKVTLVGFGPGNPDLLTIAGERALAAAEVIFHDDLINQEFLEHYPAEKIYVGKRRHRHSHEQEDINEPKHCASERRRLHDICPRRRRD